MARQRPTARAIADQPTCLLLAPSGCDVPGDLLEGLRSRNVVVREVGDAPAVMASLADGKQRIVILIERDLIRDCELLVSSIRRYHPQVIIWQYSISLDPPLQPLRPSAPEAGRPSQAVTWEGEAPAGPSTKVAKSRPLEPVVTVAPMTKPVEQEQPAQPKLVEPEPLRDTLDESPLITEEELAMLLGDDDKDLETAS